MNVKFSDIEMTSQWEKHITTETETRHGDQRHLIGSARNKHEAIRVEPVETVRIHGLRQSLAERIVISYHAGSIEPTLHEKNQPKILVGWVIGGIFKKKQAGWLNAFVAGQAATTVHCDRALASTPTNDRFRLMENLREQTS